MLFTFLNMTMMIATITQLVNAKTCEQTLESESRRNVDAAVIPDGS